jgi:hypothetical protein
MHNRTPGISDQPCRSSIPNRPSGSDERRRLGAAEGLRIAHVGYTGSDDDRDRWLMVEIWLTRNDELLLRRIQAGDEKGLRRVDFMDLNGDPPRDFLAESGDCDVVITHDLWVPLGFSSVPELGPTAVSPLQSPSRWRERLRDSGAAYIFLFGSDFTGAYLDGEIPGYRCVSVPASPPLSVFVKAPSDASSESLSREISYRDLTGARLSSLSFLLRNRALDLAYTNLDRPHFTQIAAMKNLVDLRLVGTSVSDADLEQVARNTGLRILNLDGTRIASGGLAHVKNLANLECLSLNDTSIDDEGLPHLRALGNLQWLSLVNTKIGDSGLAHLDGLCSLRWLGLVGTACTAIGLRNLRLALPQCVIDPDI